MPASKMDVFWIGTMILPMLFGGGGANARSDDFGTELSAISSFFSNMDAESLAHLESAYERNWQLVSTQMDAFRQNLEYALSIMQQTSDAQVDAEVMLQKLENTKALQQLQLDKANAQAKLEYQQKVGELYNDLLEQYYDEVQYLNTLSYAKRKELMVEYFNMKVAGMQQLSDEKKAWFKAIMSDRQKKFQELISTYLHLDDMQEDDRQEYLARLEQEKDRYASQINYYLDKLSEEDEVFMQLMKIKHDAVQDMLDRADSIYLHDTDANTMELEVALKAMNEATLNKAKLELEYQTNLQSMQLKLMAGQMQLDQQRQIAAMNAETEKAKAEAEADYYLQMQQMENDTAVEMSQMEAEVDKQRMQQNVLLVNSLADAKVESQSLAMTGSVSPTPVAEKAVSVFAATIAYLLVLLF